MKMKVLFIGGPRDAERIEIVHHLNIIGTGDDAYYREEHVYLGGTYILYVHGSVSDPIPVLLAGYRSPKS